MHGQMCHDNLGLKTVLFSVDLISNAPAMSSPFDETENGKAWSLYLLTFFWMVVFAGIQADTTAGWWPSLNRLFFPLEAHHALRRSCDLTSWRYQGQHGCYHIESFREKSIDVCGVYGGNHELSEGFSWQYNVSFVDLRISDIVADTVFSQFLLMQCLATYMYHVRFEDIIWRISSLLSLHERFSKEGRTGKLDKIALEQSFFVRCKDEYVMVMFESPDFFLKNPRISRRHSRSTQGCFTNWKRSCCWTWKSSTHNILR